MRRWRVLFVTPSFFSGGAEQVILRVLDVLDAVEIERHLAVVWGEGPLLSEVPAGVIVHDLRCKRVRYAMVAIVRLVWGLRPRVVFTTLSRLNLTILALKPLLPPGTKIVVREANTPSVDLEKDTRFPGLIRALYRWLYPRADAVVCQSKAMVADIMEGFPRIRDKLVKIYNPISVEKVAQATGEAKSPYHSGRNIVSCGRLEPQKGFDVLLSSFSMICDQREDVWLTIIGEGSLRGELVELATRLGISERVDFVGAIANPYPYFGYADLFVLASRWEGLPNVALESIASGTPVVATSCPGGTAEVVREGVNGWLAAPENEADLARKMLAGLEGCRQFDRTALTQSLMEFAPEVVGGQYRRLFLSLVADTGGDVETDVASFS